MTDTLNTLAFAYLQRQQMLQDRSQQGMVDTITQAARDASAMSLRRQEQAQQAGAAAGTLGQNLSYAPDTKMAGMTGELQGQADVHLKQLANQYMMTALGYKESEMDKRAGMRFNPSNISAMQAVEYAKMNLQDRENRRTNYEQQRKLLAEKMGETDPLKKAMYDAMTPADQKTNDAQQVQALEAELYKLQVGTQMSRQGGAGAGAGQAGGTRSANTSGGAGGGGQAGNAQPQGGGSLTSGW